MKIDQNTGNIWFTTFTDNKLGVIQKIEKNQSSGNRINVSSSQYKVSEFNLGNESFPSGIYLKGDSVWVTQSLNNKLVQFKVITDANGMVVNVLKILEIPSPASSTNNQVLFDSPYDLVVLGNKLWVTEHDANFITAYNMGSKSVTKFADSSNPHQYVTLPFWLREGDGGVALWFNEHYGNRMAFFNTTGLTLTEYEIPTRDPNLGYISNALNFAVDPTNNKNVWFSEYNHDKIGLVKSSVSIPFNIQSSVKKVVLSKMIVDKREKQKNATTTVVNFEISKNLDNNKSSSEVFPLSSNNNNHEIVFFKTSSSMTHFGVLNSTANFSVNYIDLAKMKNRTAQVAALYAKRLQGTVWKLHSRN